MASPLSDAHIEAMRRLRVLASRVVEQSWRDLGSWNREDIDRFTSQVVPVVLTAQRSAVVLTDAYLARALERQPLGIDQGEVIGASLRGTSPQEVYSRPFVTMWSALGSGALFDDAFSAAASRATATAAMDVQMAMRSTANAVQQADPQIIGYERVADAGACEFCQEVDTAFVKSADAMALHNNCGCGLEPVTVASRGQRIGQKGQHGKRAAVHQHGELGAVLTDAAHDFTSAAAALA